MNDALARKQALRKQLIIFCTTALLFAAQRKGLIADAETLIAELNQVGYRNSAAVIAQLKSGLARTITLGKAKATPCWCIHSISFPHLTIT